jgi:hypothetical protein
MKNNIARNRENAVKFTIYGYGNIEKILFLGTGQNQGVPSPNAQRRSPL